jgi:hypothetical protein
MSPEERRKIFAQVPQRMGTQGPSGPPGGGGMMIFGGGPGGMGGPGGEGDLRKRRQSQLNDTKEVKERIVLVKQGDQYVPRLVKIGVSNFDYSEVLEGLKEGDQLQVTTISRAKIEAEQMNARMKSMQGLGGMPGGGPPSGGGPPPGR